MPKIEWEDSFSVNNIEIDQQHKNKFNHMFQMSRMILPDSTSWNMGYGLNQGEVLEDQEGLATMRHLGKCIDWLGKSIKPNMANFPKG